MRSASLVAKMPWGGADAVRRALLRDRLQGGVGLGGNGGPGGRGGKGAKGAKGGSDIDDHIRLAVREESAVSLGRAGHRLQEAVAALADYDREHAPGAPAARPALPADPLRLPLVAAAAGALWAFVVQREAVGITSHDLLEQVYGVTPELWRLMGSADVGGQIPSRPASPRG